MKKITIMDLFANPPNRGDTEFYLSKEVDDRITRLESALNAIEINTKPNQSLTYGQIEFIINNVNLVARTALCR